MDTAAEGTRAGQKSKERPNTGHTAGGAASNGAFARA